MQTDDTLAFLLGTWDLVRSIEDHRSGTSGLFQGRATLVRTGSAPSASASTSASTSGSACERARYEESGHLRFGSRTTRASRSLLFERLGNASVMMRFADGRPFVDLNLESGEWRSVHPCVDDSYEMTTTVCSQNLVWERWRVTGPSKDYEALTTLTRVG